VRTQVCVGDPTTHRYRIDLVVEGMQGRLAVECEGDVWQGQERYDVDVARQRDLERAGWEFVRLRGGEFYRDRDTAAEPLWSALDRLGIRPGGIDDDAEDPPSPLGSAGQDFAADEVFAISRAAIDSPEQAAAAISAAPVSTGLVEAFSSQNDLEEDPASAAAAGSRRRRARRATS
jgi:hypothetical protein